MLVEKDTILETYYDHYKETSTLSKEAQSRRNKNFAILCVLEAVSFLMTRNPDLICGLLNDAAKEELETTIQVSNGIMQTLIWVLIAYVLVRYVQDVLYVERQYVYLDKLEKKINEFVGDDIFSLEGDYYLDNYPVVLNFVDLFYKFFSPILFTLINVVHIIEEWRTVSSKLALACDTVICVAIFIITWFYFFEVHTRIATWSKKCKPIEWMAKKLRDLLKNV